MSFLISSGMFTFSSFSFITLSIHSALRENMEFLDCTQYAYVYSPVLSRSGIRCAERGGVRVYGTSPGLHNPNRSVCTHTTKAMDAADETKQGGKPGSNSDVISDDGNHGSGEMDKQKGSGQGKNRAGQEKDKEVTAAGLENLSGKCIVGADKQ